MRILANDEIFIVFSLFELIIAKSYLDEVVKSSVSLIYIYIFVKGLTRYGLS